MVNPFQESLMITDRKMRPAYAQTATGLVLVIAIVAFGLFATSHAIGQESKQSSKAATANVLPPLFISDESLAPHLDWILATGDGGATIEPQSR
jgi:hypothetical protein